MKNKPALNLTKREIVLVGVLLLVLFWFAVGRLVILPAIANNAALQVELADMELQKQDMDTIVAASGNVEQQLADEKAKVTAESYFYRALDDVAVDRTCQALARNHGLSVVSSTITAATETAVNPYYGAPRVLIYPIKDSQVIFDEEAAAKLAEDVSLQPPSTEDGAELPVTTLPMISNTISVTGPINGVIDLLQEVARTDKSMYVSDVSLAYNFTESYFAGTITINFFFLE